MGLYDIKLYGTKVKVRLVNDHSVVAKGIVELTSQISSHPSELIAVDLKGFDESNHNESSSSPKLLLLYAKDRCLIINFTEAPKSLFHLRLFFRYSGQYFFVGTDIDSKVLALENCFSKNSTIAEGYPFMKMRAEIGNLAARVCKKAELSQFDELRDLGNRVGINLPEEVITSNWPPRHATLFTDEEIKYAISDAHLCYRIAQKCLSMLPHDA